MKSFLAFVALVLLPTLCFADDRYPALHFVTGVASHDTLNVREAPSASANVVGEFAFDATQIEVVDTSTDGRWGRVNINEHSGWTSMRFLERSHADPELPPLGMRCFGTEPFWDLDMTDRLSARFSKNMDGQPRWLQITAATKSTNRTDRFGIIAEELTGIVVLEACSDGMSDRAYGARIDLIETLTGHSEQFSGCCTYSQ